MVSFIYLLFNLSLYPLVNLQLNRVHVFLVFMNVFTLFAGIMLHLANFVDKMNMRNGRLSSADTTRKDSITVFLFFSNMFVPAAPIVLDYLSK